MSIGLQNFVERQDSRAINLAQFLDTVDYIKLMLVENNNLRRELIKLSHIVAVLTDDEAVSGRVPIEVWDRIHGVNANQFCPSDHKQITVDDQVYVQVSCQMRGRSVTESAGEPEAGS